jgi:hypothetical protein
MGVTQPFHAGVQVLSAAQPEVVTATAIEPAQPAVLTRDTAGGHGSHIFLPGRTRNYYGHGHFCLLSILPWRESSGHR